MANKYSETTKGVKISVVPAPLEGDSDPEKGMYAFSYTITIENVGQKMVQLLERHWIIKSAEIQIGEVVGPGVVGEQPKLKSGEVFEYTSGAVIRDPIGSMEGEYTFKGADDQHFTVKIPRFELRYPSKLH